jgi:hypothetical protein
VQENDHLLLYGGYGFTEESAHRVRAPVSLQIVAGDGTVYAASHMPEKSGSRGVGTPNVRRRGTWERFHVASTVPHGPLRIEVSTEDNSASHFCLALTAALWRG